MVETGFFLKKTSTAGTASAIVAMLASKLTISGPLIDVEAITASTGLQAKITSDRDQRGGHAIREIRAIRGWLPVGGSLQIGTMQSGPLWLGEFTAWLTG
jgi:hypothetical protein